ncbi:MAG: hypothetical protein V3W41_19690 [Planctomycetota bacterium]
MSITQSILLFLPLAAVICFFCSLLRRPAMDDVFKAAGKMFLYMSGTILAICAVLHFTMEFLLAN